jgi:uncharacterized protein (DUF433 family)
VKATTKGGGRDIYGGRDPVEIPAYTIADAAQWVRVPQSTTRAWLLGQRGFEPVVAIADRPSKALSFRNLVELHVLAAIRREHEVPMQRVRLAVDFMKKSLGVPNPLSSLQMLTDGRDLLLEAYELVNVTRGGQMEMRELVQAYLARIEHDARGPVRLYPFSRKNVLEDPRSIAIDPRIQFGRPCLAGTGIPTFEIADRCKAGESIASLAEDYGRPAQQIEEAIRYELPLAA